MMVNDITTGEVEQLIAEELPNKGAPRGLWSWNPEMTRGITSSGAAGGLGEQIYFFSEDGWDFWDFSYYQAFGTDWSPDGKYIAFVGALGEGLVGPQQLNASYNLYIMNPDTLASEVVVENFYEPMGTAWSPDSNLLAFEATFKNFLSEQKGLWLYNTSTKELSLIVEGAFSTPAWSSDGTQLATLQFSETSTDNSEVQLVVIDIATPK
jgi:Tol biopolymer transport system component